MADHRAAALLQARLLPEARLAAEESIELLTSGGYDDMVAAARLDLASIAILSGAPETARAEARSAARSLAARGKPVNAAIARLVGLRADLAAGRLGRTSLARVLEAESVLADSGWELEAVRARLLAARVALVAGQGDAARGLLGQAQSLTRRGTLPDRIELAYVRALVAAAGGENAEALASLRRGLALLEEYRAGFGAIELRSTISALGDEPARLGLELALQTGRPAAVLEWAERTRAGALRLPPVRPPSDPELRAAQVELRRVTQQIRANQRQGTQQRQLAARQRALEQTVRERVRYVAGGSGAVSGVVDRRDLARAAGDRVLVEYVAHGDRLAALVLRHGRLTLHELRAQDVENELGWLRFSLAQAARRRDASRAGVAAAAQALDAALLGPVESLLGDAPLVLVPTGALHALPWSELPSLRARPVVVAPSLTTWLELSRRPSRRSRQAALAAGPRLRHAGRELQALAPVFSGATVLRGSDATVAAALEAFDGAAIAHVACHGRFRSDNPLFSSLELADGPLTALDLQQLRRVPETFVLSACDLALSELNPGDELLGFAAALLAIGTRTIVASVVPVPDAATRRLMLEFHRLLASGHAPSIALARAQADAPVAGFVCLGAD
jgi:CHAT domain-containing protein